MKLSNITFGILTLALTGASQSWQAGELTVTTTNNPMSIKVSAGAKTLLDITSIAFGGSSYSSISSVATATDALEITLSANTKITVKPVLNGINFYGKSASANSVKITMKDQNDHFFGITEQNTFGNSPDIRGRTLSLSKSAIESGNNEPFARVYSAFYMSSLGYGSFFNTFAEGQYSFGISGATTIIHNTNTIDWYIYYGPTGDKIHRGYFNTFKSVENLGARSPTKKVTIWACGLTIWHNNYANSNEALSHVTKYTDNKIPITAQWIDRPYSNGGQGWGQMDFSSSFANPGTWIKKITQEYNVKFMTWVAPCTFGNPVPPSGTCFTSGHYYLDLSNPSAVSWYKQKLTDQQLKVGVQGHKMDRCDENLSAVVDGSWKDGTPSAEKACKYMYLNAVVTDEILRAVWGDDQFCFPRGAYHRSQPYNSAVWGADSYAPWPGLVGSVANAIKTSFIGFPMWGSDIGGYRTGSTKIPKDQYMRWLTFGCFSGFMENMLDGKEPYIYTSSGDAIDGQSFVERYRSVCELRQSLLPYIYSLANTSTDCGVMMQPLPYMYPEDDKTYSIGDEYMFGPAFLVAPIISSSMTRNVYLPAGNWHNFFNPTETHTSGSFTTPSTPLYQIPVYVKANSIYVTGQIYPGNSIKWITNYDATRNIVINATPGNAGESAVFTYIDYLDKDAKKVITLNALAGTPNILRVQSPAMTVPGAVKVRMSAAPASVRLNNIALTASQYQYTAETLTLQVPFAAQQPVDLQINGMVAVAGEKQVPPSLAGTMRVRVAGRGIELVVPPALGMHTDSRIEIRLFDMQGKLVWKDAVSARRISASPCAIPLPGIGKGSYLATVTIDGKIAQRSKLGIQ